MVGKFQSSVTIEHPLDKIILQSLQQWQGATTENSLILSFFFYINACLCVKLPGDCDNYCNL